MKKLHRYVALSGIILMFFIDYIGIGLVYPIFSAMLFGSNGTLLPPETSQATRGLWLGFIIALMPMAQFFSGPILGTFSDRIGRKKLILVSIAFGVFGYIVAVAGIYLNNLILLALSRIMVGIAGGNWAVGGAAIADVSAPEEKAKNFGIVHMAAGFGFTVGPFLGGKLPGLNLGICSGYAAPFICAGLLGIINLLAIVLFFKETHSTPDAKTKMSFGVSNIKKAWVSANFFLLFLAIFFYNLGFSFYWEFIPAYWIKAYNFDTNMVGNMYAWGAIVYALSAGIFIRPVVSRFKTEKILFYSLILCAISVGLHLVIQGAWFYWVSIPIQQYLFALIFPTMAALVSNKSSDDMQGEAMGIFESVQSFALIIAPLIAGGMLGITVKMPLIIGAGMLLIAAYILQRSWHTHA